MGSPREVTPTTAATTAWRSSGSTGVSGLVGQLPTNRPPGGRQRLPGGRVLEGGRRKFLPNCGAPPLGVPLPPPPGAGDHLKDYPTGRHEIRCRHNPSKDAVPL